MHRYEEYQRRRRSSETSRDLDSYGSDRGGSDRDNYGSGIARGENDEYGESDDGYDAVIVEEDDGSTPGPGEPQAFGSDQGVYVRSNSDSDLGDDDDVPFRTADGYEMAAGGFYEDAPLSRGTLAAFDTGDRALSYRGIGPKGYQRSDASIYEDICDALSTDPQVNAAGITVEVEDAEATLTGTVDSRPMKHRAEDIAASCPGLVELHNRLRVNRR